MTVKALHSDLDFQNGPTKLLFRELDIWFFITKTRPCNIQKKILVVKMKKFTGKKKIFFLIFAQNIDCGYTLEPPRRGGSNEYPESMF